MKLKAVHCHGCHDRVYSRAAHDFRHCSCGSVFVDGGREYFKYGCVPNAEFDITEVEVEASLQDLYDDWNEMHDKYGIINFLDKSELS